MHATIFAILYIGSFWTLCFGLYFLLERWNQRFSKTMVRVVCGGPIIDQRESWHHLLYKYQVRSWMWIDKPLWKEIVKLQSLPKDFPLEKWPHKHYCVKEFNA